MSSIITKMNFYLKDYYKKKYSNANNNKLCTKKG